MAFFKATVVLLALCSLDGSLAGRIRSPSRSPSPSRACQKCPDVQHPTQQCSVPTLCDHGGCSIPLNRCGAEYINAHHGLKLDLKLFDKKSNDNSYQETIDDDRSVYQEIYYDPDTHRFEGVTPDHVRDTKKYKYLTAEDAKNLPVVEATTNSLDDESIENVTDEDDFASVNTPPKSGGTSVRLHVHKVGCTTCGKHYTCEDNSDCREVYNGAYCYKNPPNSLAGFCYVKFPQLTDNGWKWANYCCEQ